MVFGTLFFSDSMSRPSHLDSRSCDWYYPIQSRVSDHRLADTRDVRICYRSKRVDIRGIFDTGVDCINAQVFLHNADDLVPGAVRMYLWRKATNATSQEYTITPLRVGTEDFLEMPCMTRTITKGIAIGTVLVDSVFTDMQIVVMQPCSGVSVYFSPAGISRGPTVGPSSPAFTEAPLSDTFDYGESN